LIGDFNDDGKADLVFGYDRYGMEVFLSNGDGTFSQAGEYFADAPTVGAIGDFNGDGVVDLAVVGGVEGDVTVFLGNGDGTFTLGGYPDTGLFGGGSEVVSDINGDGISDVALVTNSGPPNVLHLLMTQLTETAAATASGISPVGIGTHQIVANYPGDNNYAASVSTPILLNGSAQTATPVFNPAGGTYAVGPQAVTIADSTPGAVIYYTIDGTTPTAGSIRYTGAITVNSTTTLEAIAVATGYSQSSVATARYTIAQNSLTLVDPTPFAGVSLLDGASVVSASTKSGADRLATQGRIVSGVAADGVAEVVIRIPASQVGQAFTLTVLTEPKDDGSTQPSTLVAEDGGLAATGPAPNFQSSVTVSAVATSQPTPCAFAVYRAPLDFVRAGNTYDAALSKKSIVIATSNQQAIVTILRPPVFLIHGIWGQRQDWLGFSALMTDGRFRHYTADYSSTNGQSVTSNEIVVQGQLRQLISSVATEDSIAIVRADVVGHSMGGLATNYFQGLIHKLITIDTPHGGSQFAGLLWQSPARCKWGFSHNGNPVDGGVQDLIPGSALLTSLNSGSSNSKSISPLLAHAIVGVASQDQETTNYAAANSLLLELFCPGLLTGGFEQVFGGTSDLIVSLPSQQSGFPSAAVTTSNGVIHAVINNFFPDGPDALDQVISNGSAVPSSSPINSPIVVNLLNTFITNSAFVGIQP
jgi:pimeloyl-ACP methyl ester carboxylesterase